MNVVIVESAAKAKTINKYLGPNFKVIASFGHVRDLPSKDGSVEPDNDFEMHWDTDSKSQKILKEITDQVKKADKLILATDPDREGEAISWHILQVLEKRRAIKKGTEVERVAFNAVTKKSILEALDHPRQIDSALVSAYLARRALDYLVGFNLSPVLWRKLPGSRSAGRVQSVALRLVCEREGQIEAFKPVEYWSIQALLEASDDKKSEVRARLVAIDGKTLKPHAIANDEQAGAIKAATSGQAFTIGDVDKKAVKRNPYAPFTTSTLQQEASRKLGFSAKRTMQVAQRLYEGVNIGGETTGLITYMRTDGVQIDPDAIKAIRSLIAKEYNQANKTEIANLTTKNYVAPFIREYKAKAKNAQEAHEAVRPTDVTRHPKDVSKYLDDDQSRLYELVWKRAVASQMASAEFEQTSANFPVKGKDGKPYGFRATGSVMKFDGFMKLYQESRDDDEDEESRRLPPLNKGDTLKEKSFETKQHFTEPPPRFTEASLVKRMEELGIGRPSTYASTLAVLEDRGYVRNDKKRLVPEDKGRLVTAFLENFFRRYVEYDFTADLEEKLDLISDNKLEWKDVLREFWINFTNAIGETKDLRVAEVLDTLNEILGPHVFPEKEDGTDPRKCPSCEDGKLSLKTSSKFGAFIGCGNYPACRFTRQLSQSDEDGQANTLDGKELGFDPESGIPITMRTGRFGPYVQLGEAEGDEKPKRASIPKGIDAASVDLEYAAKLLSLPREVGAHPETSNPISAGIGRYGPFVLHDGLYANLESIEDVFTVGLNRAVTLLAEKAAGKGKGRYGRAAKSVIKDLGEHPEQGGKMEVLDGRYGPYVTHNKINATIPKGTEPEKLTVEEAVTLLAERAAKGGKKPARKAAKKTAKKTATKKTTTKKAPAKKTTTTKAPAKKAAAKKSTKSSKTSSNA